ncbi:C-terminal binding protein [Virgibacillus sp. W0181]|uniref:C-terminal binding protein n=1 Tax=Virgibacillus sp. W0181 TaxID=3391581 RepID=UPI003F48CC80
MSKEIKVVVTDYEYQDLRFEEKVLSEIPNVRLVKGNAKTDSELLDLVKDADGVINQYASLGSDIIEQMEKCKVISRYGVGVNTIDLVKATEKGICVTNVPDYCMEEVSDHALALLLSSSRKITLLNTYVKNKVWDFKKAIPIHRSAKQKVGILGFGRIPRRLVAKLISIGFEVLVYDPYVSGEVIEKAKAKSASLEEIFEYSDFVSVHMPLTKNTEGIINKNLFNISKETLVIINTSRGPIINESDLIDALESNKIGGAALDVTDAEPIKSDNPLLNMENVILTPHVAWYSEESQEEMRTKCARNVLQVLRGEHPTYLVNREVSNS